MNNPKELLNHFFRVLGLSQLQIETSQQQMCSEKGFNLQAAYEFFDQQLKGYISETDIRQAVSENSLLLNDSDAFYALSVLDIQGNGHLTHQGFLKRLCSSSIPEVNYNIQSRQKSKLSMNSKHILLNLIRSLAKIGKEIEKTKQELGQLSDFRLFSQIDRKKKGDVNFEDIQAFISQSDTVNYKSLKYIEKAMEVRKLQTICKKQFQNLIFPYQNNKNISQQKNPKRTTQNQLQGNRFSTDRHKTRQSTGSIWKQIEQKKISPPNICKTPKKSKIRRNTQETSITESSVNDKQSELRESLVYYQTKILSKKSSPFDGGTTARFSNLHEHSKKFYQSTLNTHKQARSTIEQIENRYSQRIQSPRFKTSIFSTVPFKFSDIQLQTQQLIEQRSRKAFLQIELNRSRSKIIDLESRLGEHNRLTIDRNRLLSPQHKIQETHRLNFNTKQRLVDVQYEKLKSQLEYQKRFRSII